MERLMQRLQELSPQMHEELAAFVEYLAAHDPSRATEETLRESLANLDSASLPPLADQFIRSKLVAAHTRHA